MNMIRSGALILAATVSLGACGGDDSDSSGGGSGDALTRAELITKANAICSTAQAKAAAVEAPTSLEDAAVASAYFDKIAPITDAETKEIAALRPAAEVKTDWDAFVTSQQAANELLKTITRKAKARDASGQQDLAKAQGAGQAVATAATKVGASNCAA